jgi:hypothetical protein
LATTFCLNSPTDFLGELLRHDRHRRLARTEAGDPRQLGIFGDHGAVFRVDFCSDRA